MPESFAPVRAALPPRRDEVSAALSLTVIHERPVESIIVNKAQERMWMMFGRVLTPEEVNQILIGAINGSLIQLERLLQCMADSWPKFQTALNEIASAVAAKCWEVKPYCERGEKPDAASEKLAKETEGFIWRMRPIVEDGELDFEDTVRAMVLGYFAGHYVAEIMWNRRSDGTYSIRGTKTLEARYYGYPSEGRDRLMLDREGLGNWQSLEDFEPHRFLIGINKGHSGHASVAAPFRALVGYWLAAVYGLKWFLGYTQLYGIPFRWATTGGDKEAAGKMMTEMGAQGWGVFDPQTELHFESASASGQSLPQKVLIDAADQQCDIFISGQTLTSTVSKEGGARALGEVHQDTKAAREWSIADWCGKIMSRQLVPAALFFNYGEVPENAPEVWPKREEKKDSLDNAQRMEIVTRILSASDSGVSEEWVYGELGAPIPAKGDALFKAPEPAPINPGADPNQPPKPGDPPVKKPQVKAADAEPTEAEKAAALMERFYPLLKSAKLDEEALAAALAAAHVSGTAS